MRMFKTMGFGVTIGAAALLAGCLDEKRTSDSDIQVMRVEQVDAALKSGDAVLVDVRTREAYNIGHIPGAISMPLPTIRPGDPRLTNAKRIIVYAGGWTDPLSSAATKRMLALGYDDVYEFKGGTDVWLDAGGRLIEADPDAAGRRETER